MSILKPRLKRRLSGCFNVLKDKSYQLIVILGPTASGKSSLALFLAKRYGAQIVNADSMQIYRQMQIGTAKPSAKEREQIKHHMFDVVSVNEQYSAAQFVKDASECIDSLILKNIPIILVGGTGLYVDSLLYSYDFKQIESDPNYRYQLEQLAKQKGNLAVYNLLSQTDPDAAARLHPNDVKRVIRALEVFKATGNSITKMQNKSDKPKYKSYFIGLDYRKRENLYSIINDRVDQMIEAGLVSEAKGLLDSKIELSKTAKTAIGYQEMFDYLNGDITLQQAADKIKQRTRNYAKRQLTWFRKSNDINWYYPDDYQNREQMFKAVCEKLDNFFEVLMQ